MIKDFFFIVLFGFVLFGWSLWLGALDFGVLRLRNLLSAMPLLK